jgi:hypothetical protein
MSSSYELQITRTNKRKNNKTMYFVERLEGGKVINTALVHVGGYKFASYSIPNLFLKTSCCLEAVSTPHRLKAARRLVYN